MFYALKEADKKNKIEKSISLFFILHESLIYYFSEEYLQLYLSRIFELEIFRLIYNQNAHAGRYRIYQRIIESLYFYNLIKRVKLYIDHYHEYCVNQITRYKSYRALVPILSPAVLYHIMVINFILALPEDQGFNILIIITNKFSKRVILVFGRDTDLAEVQTKKILDRWQTEGQGILKTFILDRDSKFISEFQREVFKLLGVKFLTTTTYHL